MKLTKDDRMELRGRLELDELVSSVSVTFQTLRDLLDLADQRDELLVFANSVAMHMTSDELGIEARSPIQERFDERIMAARAAVFIPRS